MHTKVSYRVVAPDGRIGIWNDDDDECRAHLIALTQRADLLWYGGTVERRILTTTETEDITTVYKPEPTIVALVPSHAYPGTSFTKGPYHTEAEARKAIDHVYGERPYVLKRMAPL